MVGINVNEKLKNLYVLELLHQDDAYLSGVIDLNRTGEAV